MKLTFFSNYFNHHQKALCDEFYAVLKEDFTFVETEPMEEFRSKMGWGQEVIPPYVLKSHIDEKELKKACFLADESDVVIIGTAPEDMIKKRLEDDRLTFRYSERPLKEGRWKVLVPYLAKKFYVNHYSNRNKKLYLLAAGAFVESDYHFLHSYKNKCYKFGYFPREEQKSFEELEKLKAKNRLPKILWAGRLLKLKRADLFIYAAKKCRDEGLNFTVEIVGDGEEEKKLIRLVKELKLDDITEFMGYLSPEDTRAEMEKANIFVMTSNKLEGWGAVIYEALSAGCATVASHAAGAAPWLISQGQTGYIFRSGDEDSLADKLMILLKNEQLAHELGRAAYLNMQRYWNPKTAAERFLSASECLLKNETFEFDKGPMSPAGYLKDNWYRERI